MRLRKVIRWALIGLLLAALLAVGLIYVLISRVPSAYRPMHLDVEQQNEEMAAFVQHINDFGNLAGAGKTFSWSITDRQVNAYLASIDAIASLPFKEPIHPTAELERAGFCDPAVAMHDGVLTLMVHAREYGKIVSVDVEFAFDSENNATVRILAMRVGALPVPREFLADGLERVKAELVRRLDQAEDLRHALIGPVPVGRLARLLRKLLDMLDGQYVRPEVTWPLGRHRVLIDRVEITAGRLTVRAQPLPRPKRKEPSGRPEDAAGQTSR